MTDPLRAQAEPSMKLARLVKRFFASFQRQPANKTSIFSLFSSRTPFLVMRLQDFSLSFKVKEP